MSDLKFHCENCGGSDVVEELCPVETHQFIDFCADESGTYDVESIGEFIPDCETVHVHYKCGGCGNTIMEGTGLEHMRKQLYEKLKEMNR